MNSVMVANATHVGWVKDPDTRGTLQIITSCLFTIIACTWSVLYVNLPAPEEGFWTRALRKLKWAMNTIFWPERVLIANWVERLNAEQLMISLRAKEERGELEGIPEPSGENSSLDTIPPSLWTVRKASPG